MMKRYRIVTIEREYASGGKQVARLLGDQLELPVYGKELTQYVARQLNIPLEHIKDEEKPANSLLYSLSLIGQMYRGEFIKEPVQEQLKHGEQELIDQVANHQSCILLGRCAGWTLRERADVLSVFIAADKRFRLDRAITEYAVEPSQAKGVLAKYDRQRAGYYHELTGGNWHEKKGYHLVLDSSKLGIEACVDILAGVFKAGHPAGRSERFE